MTTARNIEDLLTEVADMVSAEPDLVRRAELVGAFRQTSTRLGQDLLAATGYALRDRRVNVNDLAVLMHAGRSTLNAAILRYCALRGLKPPRGFDRRTIDPDKIVTLPPRKGE